MNWFKKTFQKIKVVPTKQKILVSSLVVGFLCIGGFLGYTLGNTVFAGAVDYSSLNENELEDDMNQLMKKFGSANLQSDLSKTFKPYEIANISIEKIKSHDYVYSIQKGLVVAMGVKQSVNASTIKNKNSFFMENISAGFVNTGKRFYQEGDTVKTYTGSNVKAEYATWTEQNVETLSKQRHEEKWGKDLSRPLVTIISSKTVLSSETEVTDNGYKVTLKLDPIKSVLRYVRQMISISGISNPKFNSIEMTIETDKNLNLLTSSSDEDYTVQKGPINAASTGQLTEVFTYDIEKQIPKLDEKINYKED